LPENKISVKIQFMKIIVKKILKNAFYPLIILLSVLFAFMVRNPFYLNSTPITTITSRHNWQNFSAYKDKKIFAHQKLKAEFKASNNRLGIIEVEFNISAKWPFIASDFDSVIFRIKEKGTGGWYYENTLNNIRTSNAFHAFGFPVIKNSKNKIYEIEIESVAGADNNAFSLSSKDAFFLSKYSFPRNYLQQDKKRIVNFLFRKTLSFFASLASVPLANYLFILFFSFSFSIIQRLTKIKNQKRKINEAQKIFINFSNNLWLLIIGIIITLIFYKNSEALEWSMYQASAIGIVLVAFIFGYFLKNKVSVVLFRKLLNFYTISFASFVLFLSLNKSIMPRHLFFLLLAFLPLLHNIRFKNLKSIFPASAILINAIGIISVLAYFDATFSKFSLIKLCLIIFITIVLFFVLQSRLKFIKTRLKIPLWILLIISLPIIFYITQKPIDYHHYSFYIGPALDIIKGKSLFGDTPSQYGYLSIHFLSFILNLIGTSLAKFNLINILLFVFYYFIASLILFKLIKNKFLATISSVVFITLQTIFSYYSESLYPSTGPMRFGLGLLTLWVLISFSQKTSFILGSIFTSIALFWSIETAVYIVPAWLAACLIFSYNSTNSFKEFLKSSIRKLSFLGITTASIFSLVVLKEYSIQHIFPRISDYFEFAITFKSGYGSILISAYGNYYPIVLIMIFGVVAIACILTSKIKTKLLPLLVFIAIHNIAIFSYFISRSHENNIVNITGFYILQLVIILNIFIKVFKINFDQLKKTIILPIILFLVLFAFRLSNQITKLDNFMQDSYKQNMTDWFNLKPVKPVLITALEKHNLKNNPIVLLSLNQDTRLLVESNLKNELPLNPAIMTYNLKSSWRVKYINPSLIKLQKGTVVIVDKEMSQSFLQPVLEDIQNTYNFKRIGIIDIGHLNIYQIISVKKI